MQDYIERFEKILSAKDRKVLSTKLKELGQTRRHRFRVALIRAMANNLTIMERLLDDQLMDAEYRRQLQVPIKIVSGKQRKLVASVGGKNRTYDKIDESTWRSIGDIGSELEIITVSLPDENMRETGVDLFDLPGFNHTKEGRLTTAKLLRQSDMILLSVDYASLPGKGDLDYLEEQLTGHGSETLYVLFFGTEHLNQEEDARILQYISDKLTRRGINNKLLTPEADELSEAATAISQATSYAEVWRLINEQAGHDSRHARRHYGQLNDLRLIVGSYADNLTDQETKLKASEQAQQTKVLERQSAFQAARMNWERIELDFQKTAQRNYDWIDQQVERYGTRIRDVASFSLSTTKDIRGWYEVQLPHEVQGEISVMQNNLSSQLQDLLVKDLQNLERNVQQQFEITYATDHPPDLLVVHNEFTRAEVADNLLKDRKYITTIFITLAAILSIPFFGPLTAALGASGGLLNELINKKAIQKQKQELLRQVHRTIDKQMLGLRQALKDELKVSYDRFLQDLKQDAEQWKHVQLNAIEGLMSRNSAATERLQTQQTELAALINDIDQSIAKF